MAKLIFVKNKQNTLGFLLAIAENQSHIDNNKNWVDDQVDIIDISSDDFNNIKKGKLINVTHDGSTASYHTLGVEGLSVLGFVT